MRLATLLFAVLAVPILFAPSSALAYEMPYDPYPWCAVYCRRRGRRNELRISDDPTMQGRR